MNLRILFLFSAVALTACGSAPTGRSTMPIADCTPITSGPTSRENAASARIADPTLPDKKIDIAAEGAFASNK